MNWERIMINSVFDANPSFFCFGYFFVPGPLGLLKFVPEEVFKSTDSIDNVSINICRKSKFENFLRGKHRQFGQKWENGISRSENLLWDKFWISQGTREKEIAKKRKARVRAKNPIDNYSFSVHYFYIEIIPMGVLRQDGFAGGINERKKTN